MLTLTPVISELEKRSPCGSSFFAQNGRSGGGGYHCLKFARPALPACVENAEQDAMWTRNAGRDEGDPVSCLDEVVEAVNYVVDKYRFDFFQWEVEFTGQIAGRTSPVRDVHLGRRFQPPFSPECVQRSEHPYRRGRLRRHGNSFSG